MAFDLKDTIRRLRHVGQNITLTENSKFVQLADAVLSVERARLDRAVKATKKTLGDWAGEELDTFWGTILSVERLPGIEDADEFLGDPSYVSRLERFMQAANSGATLEGVRIAAESGSGVPMRLERFGERIILKPQGPINAAQKAGALKNARRLAPAKARIEVGNPEADDVRRPTRIYSETNYMGQRPDGSLMDGPRWESENYVEAARSDRWARSGPGTLAETDGLAANLMTRGGVFCGGSLGAGERATLTLETGDEPLNLVRFEVGRGDFQVVCEDENGDVFVRRIYAGKEPWIDFEDVFEFREAAPLSITFVNIDQAEHSLYVRGLYIGARVSDLNREAWIALGGLKGRTDDDIVHAEARGISEGKAWISTPAPSPNAKRTIYGTYSEIPQRISSLGFATPTPGCVYEIYYSNDRKREDQAWEELSWQRLPGAYVLRSGKVDVPPFTARHFRYDITSLKPMTMHTFDGALEGEE